jgi:hypothetical protein
MENEVKKLVCRSVVRLVEFAKSGINMDYAEYERLANMASEMNANYKCTFNKPLMEVAVGEIIENKGVNLC